MSTFQAKDEKQAQEEIKYRRALVAAKIIEQFVADLRYARMNGYVPFEKTTFNDVYEDVHKDTMKLCCKVVKIPHSRLIRIANYIRDTEKKDIKKLYAPIILRTIT